MDITVCAADLGEPEGAAAALVFEYMAATLAETGRPPPSRKPDGHAHAAHCLDPAALGREALTQVTGHDDVIHFSPRLRSRWCRPVIGLAGVQWRQPARLIDAAWTSRPKRTKIVRMAR
jgi:hypothetical protein